MSFFVFCLIWEAWYALPIGKRSLTHVSWDTWLVLPIGKHSLTCVSWDTWHALPWKHSLTCVSWDTWHALPWKHSLICVSWDTLHALPWKDSLTHVIQAHALKLYLITKHQPELAAVLSDAFAWIQQSTDRWMAFCFWFYQDTRFWMLYLKRLLISNQQMQQPTEMLKKTCRQRMKRCLICLSLLRTCHWWMQQPTEVWKKLCVWKIRHCLFLHEHNLRLPQSWRHWSRWMKLLLLK